MDAKNSIHFFLSRVFILERKGEEKSYPFPFQHNMTPWSQTLNLSIGIKTAVQIQQGQNRLWLISRKLALYI